MRAEIRVQKPQFHFSLDMPFFDLSNRYARIQGGLSTDDANCTSKNQGTIGL